MEFVYLHTPHEDLITKAIFYEKTPHGILLKFDHVFDITDDNNVLEIKILKDCKINIGNCQRLRSVCSDVLTCANNNFLQFCRSLTKVELPLLTKVGDNFLQVCTALSEIKLNSLTDAGKYFLYNCRALIKIELNSLNNVGDYFLYNCSALRKLELRSLVSAGSYFMFGCSGCSHVYLSGCIDKIGFEPFYYTCLSKLEIISSTPFNIGKEHNVRVNFNILAEGNFDLGYVDKHAKVTI